MRRRGGQATTEWVALLAISLLVGVAIVARAPRAAPTARAITALLAGIAAGPRPDDASPQIALPLAAVDGRTIVAVARRVAELGIAEVPPGSNRGPGVDAFTGGRPEPWCADFVSWVLRAAGHPLLGGEDGWRLPWTGDVRAWFARRGRYRERAVAEPLPGDVVWFVHGHVGIVVGVRGTAIDTIEGNSDDAVRHRTYDGWRANPDIGGFGRIVEDTQRGRRGRHAAASRPDTRRRPRAVEPALAGAGAVPIRRRSAR